MNIKELTPLASSFGEVVRRARTNQGYTQRQLAQVCNVSPMYISQIETKNRVPSFKICRALAQALELDEKQFLLEAYRTNMPEEIRDLIKEYEPLNKADTLISERMNVY
jgi:transcriptional regulator with XRE-family HTH domain